MMSEAEQGVEPVDPADQNALDEEAQDGDEDRGDRHGSPEADPAVEDPEEVGAEGVHDPVAEVDDPGNAEDEAEPDGHGRVDQAQADSVQDQGKDQDRHVKPSFLREQFRRECPHSGPGGSAPEPGAGKDYFLQPTLTGFSCGVRATLSAGTRDFISQKSVPLAGLALAKTTSVRTW